MENFNKSKAYDFNFWFELIYLFIYHPCWIVKDEWHIVFHNGKIGSKIRDFRKNESSVKCILIGLEFIFITELNTIRNPLLKLV